MVDMVELGEMGCFGAKSVLTCFVAEWWIWLSSERILWAKVGVEPL